MAPRHKLPNPHFVPQGEDWFDDHMSKQSDDGKQEDIPLEDQTVEHFDIDEVPVIDVNQPLHEIPIPAFSVEQLVKNVTANILNKTTTEEMKQRAAAFQMAQSLASDKATDEQLDVAHWIFSGGHYVTNEIKDES